MRVGAIIIIVLIVIASVLVVVLEINLKKPTSNGIPGLPSSYVLLDSPQDTLMELSSFWFQPNTCMERIMGKHVL